MQVKGNNFKLSDSEGEELREIKSRHTNIQSYLGEALPWFKSLGIEIHLDEVPHDFQIGGKKGTGWYGSIRGEIINHVNDVEIYSSGLWGRWHDEGEKLFSLDSACGGGGNRFTYDRGSCILVETLPLVKEANFCVDEVDKLQKKFDAKLRDVIHVRNESIKREMIRETDANESRLDLVKRKQSMLDAIRTLDCAIAEIDANINHNAIINNAITLPPIESGFLNLREYNKLRESQNVDDNEKATEIDFSYELGEVDSLMRKHAEKFIG